MERYEILLRYMQVPEMMSTGCHENKFGKPILFRFS